MADEYGAIEFPLLAPASLDEAVTDPGLDKLGEFLAAALNAALNSAWNVVNPGVPFVRTIANNMPKDSTFNERDLPALFLERTSSTDEQFSDDLTQTTTNVTVLWVAQNAVQANRSMRTPGINGFQKAISRALARGRHPDWIDEFDPDPTAQSLGSVLIQRMGLSRWPCVQSCKYQQLTIMKGDTQANYMGFAVVVQIYECTTWDPAERGETAAQTATMTAGALQLENQQPPVTP